MIEFHSVWKSFGGPGRRTTVLRNLTLVLQATGGIAVIGRNGAGKSTLLNLISGTLKPDRGEFVRQDRISWPKDFRGAFHRNLTGRQNARFVARIYGVGTDEIDTYLEAFSQLGDAIDIPFRTCSAGMCARLDFGVSLPARFDCYLVDEITSVGDARYRDRCEAPFTERTASAQLIMVSHSERTLRNFCTSAILPENGDARFVPKLDAVLAAYGSSPAI